MLMDQHGLSQRDMEEITGLKQPSISRWQFGTLPKADVAVKLAIYFNTTVEELILGSGEGKEGELMLSQAQKVQGRRVIPFLPSRKNDNVVYVPYFEDIRASAGAGIEIEDYSNAVTVPILRSFIQPHNPNTVRTLEVSGDSMTDIHLLPGDVVFFVPEDNPSDGLYVIGIEDKLFVKRLEIDVLGHEIRIISENVKYPPKAVKGEDMNRLRIIGKVIGWITRHPY